MDTSTTAAPPPTPAAHPNTHLPTSAASADALSRLLHRLPPVLSLPTRRRSPSPVTYPPIISLSHPDLRDLLLSASSQLGFFQLTDHNIPRQLSNSAVSESLSLFELTDDKKRSSFTGNWPVGFEEDEGGNGESFCLDEACLMESPELGLASLLELTLALEKLGLETIDMLSHAVGFLNPLKKDRTLLRSLVWLRESSDGDDKPITWGRFYPYVVGLQYQMGCEKYSLLSDSGRITVLPQPDSVMVTIGDITQVWSNGKLKKVRGRPRAESMGVASSGRGISISLLLTLSSESIVSPLIPNMEADVGEIREEEEEKHCSVHFLSETMHGRSIMTLSLSKR